MTVTTPIWLVLEWCRDRWEIVRGAANDRSAQARAEIVQETGKRCRNCESYESDCEGGGSWPTVCSEWRGVDGATSPTVRVVEAELRYAMPEAPEGARPPKEGTP